MAACVCGEEPANTLAITDNCFAWLSGQGGDGANNGAFTLSLYTDLSRPPTSYGPVGTAMHEPRCTTMHSSSGRQRRRPRGIRRGDSGISQQQQRNDVSQQSSAIHPRKPSAGAVAGQDDGVRHARAGECRQGAPCYRLGVCSCSQFLF